MRLSLTVLFLTVISFVSSAQLDSLVEYYDNGNMKSFVYFHANMRDGEAMFYYENGNIKEVIDYVAGRVDGVVKKYNKNGSLSEFINVTNGRRHGPTDLYDEEGRYIKSVNYDKGRLIIEPIPESEEEVLGDKEIVAVPDDEDNYEPLYMSDEEASEIDPAFFISVDKEPEPVKGWSKFYEKLHYPEKALEEEVEGTVKIKAYIDYSGTVKRTEVIKGIGYGCEESAEIAINYTKFKPGRIEGSPVNTQVTFDIEFILPKTEEE